MHTKSLYYPHTFRRKLDEEHTVIVPCARFSTHQHSDDNEKHLDTSISTEQRTHISSGEHSFMSVESFLALEDSLLEHINDTRTPMSRERIDELLHLYRRLVEEVERNPDLLDEYEMAHWINGNYPRSVKLLDDIMGIWYKWWTGNSQDEMDHSPERMLDTIDNLQDGDMPLPITDRTYTTLIRAATKCASQPKEAAIFAEKLLARMREESRDFPMARPTTNTMNAVLHAWAKSGHQQAPERVQDLFRDLCEQYEAGILERPPDNTSHMALMLAWSNSGRLKAAPKVEEVLEKMRNSLWEGVEPDAKAYRIAIHTWVNSNIKASSLRVYKIFVDNVRRYMESHDESVIVDADLFSIVISKLAKDGHGDKAEEIFKLQQEFYELTGDDRFKPTRRTLLGMVIAYAHKKDPAAAEQAEELLRQVERFAWPKSGNNRFNPDLLPKKGYYVDVIKALCSNRKPGGVDRAEHLVLSMIEHHRAGAVNLLPDKYLFNGILTTWARISNRKDAAPRAEKLLKLMHDVSSDFNVSTTMPNEYSYLQVINAWLYSQHPDAPIRAEEVFFRMMDYYNNGNQGMAPVLAHYTALISCWAESKQPDASSRAQSIFDAAMEISESSNRPFKPDRTLHMSLMRAWSKVGAASKVESIFLSMYEEYCSAGDKRLMPNTEMFNIMLDAWLRSGSPEAQHKAEILFDSMNQFSMDRTLDSVVPDAYTFKKMIEIMTKSHSKDSAEIAERYLWLLMESPPILNEERERAKIFSCYVSAIAAWYRRSDAKAKERKECLIDELLDLVQTERLPLPSHNEYVRFLGTVAMSRIPGKSENATAKLSLPREKLRVSRSLL